MRDEAVRVEAAQIAHGYGVRLAEEDGNLAAEVRTFILDQAADSVRRYASLRLPRGRCVESERLDLLDGAWSGGQQAAAVRLSVFVWMGVSA